MSTVKRKQGDKPASDLTVMQTFEKAMKAGSDWSDKDEFLDVVYWLRQIIGVLIGVVWGIVPLKGILGILLFLIVNIAIVYVYFSMFQRVNEEDFGGISEIFKEGLMTSFATFVVTWIILYSALHAD
jgi:hypothetical protein